MDINKTTASQETIYAPFRPDEEAPYIFISYSHRDRNRVFPIITRLYEKGWHVWYDEGLEVTENYYTSLSRHIKNCTAFLLFVTENSVKSEFVSEHELLLATTMRKRIAICQLDEKAEFIGEAKDAIDIATVSRKNPKTDEAGLEAALEGIEELLRFAKRKAEGFKVRAHQVEILLAEEEDDFEFVKCEGGVRLTGYQGGDKHIVIPDIYKGQPVLELAISSWEKHYAGNSLIKSIRIPPTVKRIRSLCFDNCVNLTDVYIPSSVKQIDEPWDSYANRWGNLEKFTVHCAEGSAVYRHSLKFPKTITVVIDPSLDVEETIEPAASERDRYVFCSFTSDKKDDAERIIRQLISGGCAVKSSDGLTEKEKKKCYRKAACMIVFLSHEYIDEDEIDFLYRAIGENKPFLLYVLDGCMLPDDIDIAKIHDQQLRFDNGTEEDRIAKLVEWLDKNDCVPGSADIPDYEYTTDNDGNIILKGYKGTKTEVNVPARFGGHPVVALDGTFYNRKVTSVSIQDGIEKIKSRSFEGCKDLVSISFPDSITKVSNWSLANVFRGCAWYDDLPDGIVYIGKLVYDAKGMIPPELTIRKGTLYIEEHAFENCKSLIELNMPDSVIRIGEAAFIDCINLQCVNIPVSVTEINDDLFGQCRSLKDVQIPASVRIIGKRAFEKCISLTNVTIGNSVESIKEEAFYSCMNLKSITIPKNVTEIHLRAFGYYYDEEMDDGRCPDESRFIKKIDGFIIYGYPESAAERYAAQNNFTFVALRDDQ